MKVRQEFVRFLEMMRDEIRDYRQLRDLLEEQFDAALRHESARVAQVCEGIANLVDALNRRRAQRLALAQGVTKETPEHAHAAMQRMMPAASATLLTRWTEELEGLVRDCKAANLRNCGLLTEQYEIMQRVLNQEADTYAPA